MAEPSFNIESATNGLVLALFLAAALFLGVMLFYVLRDIEGRQSSSSSEVVGGDVGGIPLQVIDGETGFLVDSAEECGEKTLHLLQHPEEAERMGQAGREHVRKNFLTTRHLAEYLELFNSLK